ncbi:MAG TPA: FadR/GntR family transcriptional regulator [Vicinamibacterales bacterium]|nr:FadR/GntR family transcriptional regulator [Vicinamibacterales bacterium]
MRAPHEEFPNGAGHEAGRPFEVTAAETVVRWVTDRIQRGLLKPGERLPSERELASRIGVSRPSVRSGLRTLAAMGIVRTRHGSGTYISHGPPALDGTPLRVLAALHGMNPEQILEARRVLEVGVAGLAAERASMEQIAVLAEEVSGMFASVDNPDAFMAHDLRFHRAIANASGNPVLATLLEMITRLFFESRRRPERTPEQFREMAIVHRNIYQAVRARDAERARREMNSHLPRYRPVTVEMRR